jgi:hypothetical protein
VGASTPVRSCVAWNDPVHSLTGAVPALSVVVELDVAQADASRPAALTKKSGRWRILGGLRNP